MRKCLMMLILLFFASVDSQSMTLVGCMEVNVQSGNLDSALDCADRAVAENPNAETYVERAFVLAEKELWDRVIIDCCRSIAYRDNGNARFLRGFALYKIREFDQALEDLNRALNMEKFYGWFLYRARVLVAMNRDREAIDDLTAVIEKKPGDWDAYHQRSLLLIQVGHLEKALEDWDTAVRLNPDLLNRQRSEGAPDFNPRSVLKRFNDVEEYVRNLNGLTWAPSLTKPAH
jgi:tetratricopeptide (TPR) repeat protein